MMKRKIALLVLTLLLVAVAVPTAYAALTDDQQKALDSLYDQMAALRKQMIQQYVDAGLITAEQGKLMQERADLMIQYRKQNAANGLYGPGACGGCFGGGAGFGKGAGFRGMGPAFWGSTPVQPSASF